MRVLVLADAQSFHTLKWMKAYEAAGIPATCASVEEPREELRGTTTWLRSALRARPASYLGVIPKVRSIAHNFAADVINAHMATGYGLVCALARRHERLVVSLWGPDILETPGRGPFHRAALRLVFRRAHLLQTDARVADRILVEDFGVPDEKIFYLPYGLDRQTLDSPLARFTPGPPWRLLTHRKLEPIYSPFTVLEALRILKRDGLDFTFTFASGGSLEMAVREGLAASGIPGEVTGWLSTEELYRRIRESHIFISASLSDTTPVSLLEAMALGAFPVVSDLPAKMEWVVDGLNGALFNPTDPRELAEQVQKAISDPEAMARARELNKQLVARNADWEEGFSRFIQRVEELPESPASMRRTNRTPPGEPKVPLE